MPVPIYVWRLLSKPERALRLHGQTVRTNTSNFKQQYFEDTFAATIPLFCYWHEYEWRQRVIFILTMFLSFTGCGKITGTMHCNGKQIWILTHEWNSNRFLAYLVDSNGVNTTLWISAVGQNIAGNYQTPDRVRWNSPVMEMDQKVWKYFIWLPALFQTPFLHPFSSKVYYHLNLMGLPIPGLWKSCQTEKFILLRFIRMMRLPRNGVYIWNGKSSILGLPNHEYCVFTDDLVNECYLSECYFRSSVFHSC